MSDTWNKIYKSETYHYGVTPNAFFKSFIDGQTFRGRILMVAEGEGRNAVYAAKKGWQVEAFDLSKEAQRKALALASSMNVQIKYSILSYQEFSPEPERYHAVAMIYAHLPASYRRKFSMKLWEGMTVGGKLVMEVFSLKHLERNSFGPKDPSLLYDMNTIREDFSCFRIELLEETVVKLNEGQGHRGEADVIRMIARK